MRWLLLDLWPGLCRGLLASCFSFLILAWPLAVFWEIDRLPVMSSSRGVFSTFLLLTMALTPLLPLFFLPLGEPWLRAVVRRVRRFRTASNERIVLRYAPELHGKIDTNEVLNLAEKSLFKMEATFGPLSLFWRRLAGPLMLRKRLYVYVFSTSKAVQDIFGENFSGAALAAYHAVAISFDYPRMDELLKHEVSHLFSHRWNARPSPLLQEGLSTWLQETCQGYTIDAIAFTLTWYEQYRLRRMLSRKFFFAKENCWACYMLAGSFSGFLIRKFGWQAYRRFYRRVEGTWRFDAKFVKTFGLTLEEAEEQWRTELRERYKAVGPAWLAYIQACQDTYRPRDQ